MAPVALWATWTSSCSAPGGERGRKNTPWGRGLRVLACEGAHAVAIVAGTDAHLLTTPLAGKRTGHTTSCWSQASLLPQRRSSPSSFFSQAVHCVRPLVCSFTAKVEIAGSAWCITRQAFEVMAVEDPASLALFQVGVEWGVWGPCTALLPSLGGTGSPFHPNLCGNTSQCMCMVCHSEFLSCHDPRHSWMPSPCPCCCHAALRCPAGHHPAFHLAQRGPDAGGAGTQQRCRGQLRDGAGPATVGGTDCQGAPATWHMPVTAGSILAATNKPHH